MKYKLVADSSCDMLDEELSTEEINFETVPLTISVGDKDYVDNKDLNTKMLMEEVAKCKEASKSACPSPEAFANAMKEGDNVFCVTISNKLSGTYNSARLGMDMILEEKPNKNVYVIDSLSTSSAMSLILTKLKSLIEEGKYSFEQIKEKIIKYRESIKTRFISLDLSTLVKTGRMSKIAGLISKAFAIVPICGDNGEGEIKMLSKVIGSKKALNVLSNFPEEKIEKDGNEFPIVLSHNNNKDDALKIKSLLAEKYNLKNVKIQNTRGLASFYVNNHGIIMAY